MLTFRLVLEALCPIPGLKSLSLPWFNLDLAVTVFDSVFPSLGSMTSVFKLWNDETTIYYTFGVLIGFYPRFLDFSFSFLAYDAL